MSTPAPFDPPQPLAAPAPGVLLWWCRLDSTPARHDAAVAWLSDAERLRLQRFGTAELQARYVAGRATLRWILGAHLDLDPRRVPIVRGLRGRPRVAQTGAPDFNVSHTAAVALIGLCADARIGVDIEAVDRRINAAGIARKFMTANERATLPPNEDAARRDVLRRWTCKEAMSKATGDALSAPFGHLDVALGSAPRLLAGPAPYIPRDWALHAAAVPPDYFGTVALWRPPVAPTGPDAPAQGELE